MTTSIETLKLADDLVVSRMGYGAMQLAGPRAMGEPKDRPEALAVVKEAVESGVTYIDTAAGYGPVVTNRIIREAAHPYPETLHISTKVGIRRADDGSWFPSLEPKDLRAQVYENLDHLGLDVLDVVYLRVGASDASVAAPFSALAELQQDGFVRHLGLSGVSSAQLTEAQAIAPVVAIQNLYNLVNRQDDALVDRAAAEGIAYVSFFPLGGFNPFQSDVLDTVAAQVGATRQQVALAWLLQRSPTMVVIPGTSRRAHLRENIAAAGLKLPAEAVAQLDAIAAQ
ncbi:oxidoreductase [Micromonospora sp. WMMD812]|uniref:oxidoreductase n=1 Tax=Micromonospora sp. WMMD812 TaxID=3015152 RepID=UPI00248CF36E|nr:oxidoreductase [Micromonospora sp. WMMD812]WBB65201.1 oxidoreductase [Micromonospora sp. WMMD812]